MIKINLLPSNIFEARTIKRIIALFVVIAVVIVAGGAFYWVQLKKQTAEMKSMADNLQTLTTQATDQKTKADNERASIKPITQKLEFFKAVADYNNTYPRLYEELSRFTYGKIVYGKLSLSSGTITLEARAPSLGDAGRYLMNLYRATHLFSSISMSQVPGYSAGGAGGTSMPGIQTMPASMPSPGPMPGLGMLPPVGPTTGYAGLAAVQSGVTKTAASRKGFDFTVTCTLKTVPTAPVFGGGGQPVAPGAGGMMPTAPMGSVAPAGGPPSTNPMAPAGNPGGSPGPMYNPGPTRSSSTDGLGARMRGGQG